VCESHERPRFGGSSRQNLLPKRRLPDNGYIIVVKALRDNKIIILLILI
jgi:hypothetical protein